MTEQDSGPVREDLELPSQLCGLTGSSAGATGEDQIRGVTAGRHSMAVVARTATDLGPDVVEALDRHQESYML